MLILKTAALGAAFLASTAAMTLTPSAAQAALVKGTILFTGDTRFTGTPDFSGTNPNTDTVEFVNPVSITRCNGSFATDLSCDGSEGVDFSDLTFDPAFSTTNPLFTAGNFSYTLNSITVQRNNNFIFISGWGELSATGFDVTPATLLLSVQNQGVNGEFSFSASVEAVPEPLTILGAGTAIAFGGAFKRKLGKKDKKGSTKA